MKRKTFVGFKVLFFIPLFLIITKLAFADQIWPVQVGDWYEYTAHDSAIPQQHEWTSRTVFGSKTILGSQEYFNMTNTDSLGDGTVFRIENWYGRVTENAVYSFGWYGNIYETLDFQIAPVGTKWSSLVQSGTKNGMQVVEIVGIEPVVVPYGSFNNAYIHKTYFDPSDSSLHNSPEWYEYIVPGFGFVKSVDYWRGNAPTTLELVHTSVTPEPASMLLFGLGGISLGFFRRLKRKKVA